MEEKQPLLAAEYGLSSLDESSAADIESRFAFGRYQKVLFCKLFAVQFFAEGTWGALVSYLTLYCSGKYGLPAGQSGLYAVALFAGECVGASLFGYISDRYGRRFVMITSMSLSTIAGTCCAFCPVSTSVSLLLIALVVLGIAMGGTIPTTGCLFSEFMPPEQRGVYLNALGSAFALSSLACAGAAWYLDSVGDFSFMGFAEDEGAWRLLYASASLLELMVLGYSWKFLPESPRWLLVRGRFREAEAVLKEVAAGGGMKHKTALPQDSTTSVNASTGDALPGSQAVYETSIATLFRADVGLRSTTILLITIWFSYSLANNGFFTFLPLLFDARGIQSSSMYRDVVVSMAIGLPGIFVAGILLESPLGRRKVMGVSMAVSVASMVGFQFVDSEWAVTLATTVITFLSNCCFATMFTYAPEVFPTYLRSTALGLCNAFKCMGGIAGPYVAGIFVASDSVVAILLFAGCVAVSSVCAFLLPIETRKRHLRDS